MTAYEPMTSRGRHHDLQEIKLARVTDLQKSVDQLEELVVVNISSSLSLDWRRLPSCGDNNTPRLPVECRVRVVEWPMIDPAVSTPTER